MMSRPVPVPLMALFAGCSAFRAGRPVLTAGVRAPIPMMISPAEETAKQVWLAGREPPWSQGVRVPIPSSISVGVGMGGASAEDAKQTWLAEREPPWSKVRSTNVSPGPGATSGASTEEASRQAWLAAETLPAPAGWLALPQCRPLQLFRINDGVMGGRSSSQLAVGASGDVVFTGTINTNGGGFASFRTLGDDSPLGLAPHCAALIVDATGDGQKYKFSLHTGDSWDMASPSWGHDFVAGARTQHILPLRAFSPTRRGNPLVAAPPLDPTAVTGLGFGLSLYSADGQPNEQFGDGPFRLTIHRVEMVLQ